MGSWLLGAQTRVISFSILIGVLLGLLSQEHQCPHYPKCWMVNSPVIWNQELLLTSHFSLQVSKVNTIHTFHILNGNPVILLSLDSNELVAINLNSNSLLARWLYEDHPMSFVYPYSEEDVCWMDEKGLVRGSLRSKQLAYAWKCDNQQVVEWAAACPEHNAILVCTYCKGKKKEDISLRNLRSGQLCWSKRVIADGYTRGALSRDGSRYVVVCRSQQLSTPLNMDLPFDPREHNLYTYEVSVFQSDSNRVLFSASIPFGCLDASFSWDNRFVAILSPEGEIACYDIQSNEEILCAMPDPRRREAIIGFSPNNELIIAQKDIIQLVDFRKKKLLSELSGSFSPMGSFAFSPCGKYCAFLDTHQRVTVCRWEALHHFLLQK